MTSRFLIRKAVFATALFFGAVITSGFADGASQFADANREYAAGHYQAATDGYDTLVSAGQRNPTLFYNLGNTWFRRGDLGRAILNYERALALDPHHPEAIANLQLVRDQASALQLAQEWPERYLAFTNTMPLSWTAAVAFWVGAFALAAFFLARQRRGRALVLMLFAFLICGSSTYSLYTMDTGNRGRDLAIVTARNIQARLATADNASSILTLPVGSEVQVLSTRGDWAYAILPNNLRGWIPTNSIELVRL